MKPSHHLPVESMLLTTVIKAVVHKSTKYYQSPFQGVRGCLQGCLPFLRLQVILQSFLPNLLKECSGCACLLSCSSYNASVCSASISWSTSVWAAAQLVSWDWTTFTVIPSVACTSLSRPRSLPRKPCGALACSSACLPPYTSVIDLAKVSEGIPLIIHGVP